MNKKKTGERERKTQKKSFYLSVDEVIRITNRETETRKHTNTWAHKLKQARNRESHTIEQLMENVKALFCKHTSTTVEKGARNKHICHVFAYFDLHPIFFSPSVYVCVCVLLLRPLVICRRHAIFMIVISTCNIWHFRLWFHNCVSYFYRSHSLFFLLLLLFSITMSLICTIAKNC